MDELISLITSRVGLDAEQARKGVGLLFEFAQEKLDGGDFEKIASLLPGISQAMSDAPNLGGGLLGGLGGMLGGNLGDLAEMASGLKELDIDLDSAKQLANVVRGFLEDKGDAQVQDILQRVLSRFA